MPSTATKRSPYPSPQLLPSWATAAPEPCRLLGSFHCSAASTVASTPEVRSLASSPRTSKLGARKLFPLPGPLSPSSPPRRREQRYLRPRARVAVGTALFTALAVAFRASAHWGRVDGGGAVHDQPLTVASLIETFERTEEFLNTSGWRREGETYAPTTVELRVRERQWWVSGSHNASCNGVTQVSHLHLFFEDVGPAKLWNVLMHPDYDWNPSVDDVVYQQEMLVDANEQIDDAFLALGEARGVHDVPHKRGREDPGLWNVTGRVAEAAIPDALKRFSGGARYSADWIVSKFDPLVGRGFVLATSRRSHVLAEKAGVRKGCESCLSATLIAPAGARGTIVHSVTQIDPVAPQALHGLAFTAIRAATRRLFLSLHKKALAV